MISRNETFTSVPVFTSFSLGEWTNISDLLILRLAMHLTMFMAIFIISFPVILTGVCYTCALVALIYQKVNKLSDDYSSTSWDNARLVIAYILTGIGRIMHGKV